MNAIQVLILSVVEGITEFLPVSSTAHLVLASSIMGLEQTEFVKSFEIAVQLGAILAVVFLCHRELLRNKQLILRTLIAFAPSALIGFVLYDFIKTSLIGNGLVTALALIIGGIVFTAVDRVLLIKEIKTTRHSDITVKSNGDLKYVNNPGSLLPGIEKEIGIHNISIPKLISIGVFQSLAVVPGVSRSAASIFGGLLAGLNRADAAKFSFFLAIPTMFAATALDLYKTRFVFSSADLAVLSVGFVGAFITALFAVQSFLGYMQKHGFLPFGIYRIIVGSFWLFAILTL